MLIYNTTFVCEDCRFNEFLTWLNVEAIPHLLKSKIAYSPQLSRIVPLEEKDEKATNLSLQFRFSNADALEEWITNDLYPTLNQMTNRFGQSSLFFSTVLELLPLSGQN